MPLHIYNPDGTYYTWERRMMDKFDHQGEQVFPRMPHEVRPPLKHEDVKTGSIDELVNKIKEANTGYVAKDPPKLHPDSVCGGEINPNNGACSIGMYDCVDKLHNDGVKSPDHYAYGGIETIDYIKAKLSPEQFTGYLWGNVLKYISRFDKKEGIKDLKKAKVYIDWLVEQYEGRLVHPHKVVE